MYVVTQCILEMKDIAVNRQIAENTLFFFFIRTSNFDAEAERSYIFWRFEAETFLKMFSPDDFDGVEVILEQL